MLQQPCDATSKQASSDYKSSDINRMLLSIHECSLGKMGRCRVERAEVRGWLTPDFRKGLVCLIASHELAVPSRTSFRLILINPYQERNSSKNAMNVFIFRDLIGINVVVLIPYCLVGCLYIFISQASLLSSLNAQSLAC